MAPPRRLAIAAAFAAVYIVWGSTYLAIQFAIASIPPLLMGGARFLVAGAILYLVARASGAPQPTRVHWQTALIVGACLLLFGNGGVSVAEQFVPSGLAALVIATVPIFIALLGWLSGSAPRPTPLIWLGLAGGLAGVGTLVFPALTATAGQSKHAGAGMLILLLSALAWAVGSLYSRRAEGAPNAFLATGQQMLCGGAALVLASVLAGEWRGFDPRRISASSAWAFVYLVMIGAFVGFTAFIWLLRVCHPAKVATYAYVNPVVAVLLGAWLAGEKLSGHTVLAAALIVGSVALVISAQMFASTPDTQELAIAENAKASR